MIREVVGGMLLVVLSLYAVLAGADFGGGFWDLLAGGDVRGREPRALIDETITPVWEANHVWLVLALVIFWTAFPPAFAAVMTAAALPLWLAAFGIVLRGAGFAFRKEVDGLRYQRLLGATFAFSSLLTPFFMGTVVGAVAAGRVPVHARSSTLAVWTSPTSLLAGFLFVAVCAYLASVFLVGEAAGRGQPRLVSYFRRRAVLAALAAGALSIAALVALHDSDHLLYEKLLTRALPLVVITVACGVAVPVLLISGRAGGLRVLAAAGVACVVWGWGIAQKPRLLPGSSLTLANGSAPHGALVGVAGVFVAALVLVAPSLLLLFWLHGRRLLGSEER